MQAVDRGESNRTTFKAVLDEGAIGGESDCNQKPDQRTPHPNHAHPVDEQRHHDGGHQRPIGGSQLTTHFYGVCTEGTTTASKSQKLEGKYLKSQNYQA